jgi:mRNA interferase MazF
MVIQRGEIWWAELEEPRGSAPGYRRPVLIIQSNPFNRSPIGTVIIAAITTNLALASAPGNIRLSRRQSKLSRESVVNVSQLLTLDRRFLSDRVAKLPDTVIREVDAGLRLVLALDDKGLQ